MGLYYWPVLKLLGKFSAAPREEVIKEQGLADLMHPAAVPTGRVRSFHIEQDKPAVASFRKLLADDEKLKALFEEKLFDSVLVDLGAGSRLDGMAALAKELGVRHYVAVDKYCELSFRAQVCRGLRVSSHEDETGFRKTVVRSDMLSFLKRLKTASCSIAISAIDRIVIPDASYHQELADEIERVVPGEGLAFGILSEPLLRLRSKVRDQPHDNNLIREVHNGMALLAMAKDLPPRKNSPWKEHSSSYGTWVLEKKSGSTEAYA